MAPPSSSANGHLKPLPLPPSSSPPRSNHISLPPTFNVQPLLSSVELSSRPPASYSQHLSSLLTQSVTAASLKPETWSQSLVPSILDIPFSKWIDPLSKTMREHPPGKARPSSTLPPPPPSTTTTDDASSSSTATVVPPLLSTTPSLSQQLATYLPSIPNFQPYPSPSPADDDDAPPRTPLKPRAHHHQTVPGAFYPTSPTSSISSPVPSPSPGRKSVDSRAERVEEDAIRTVEMDGKRVVLGISVYVMEPREGEIDRVEWVEGRWAVEEVLEVGKEREDREGEEGSKTPTKGGSAGGGGFDGLPGSGGGALDLGLMGDGKEAVAIQKDVVEVKEKGRGKVLFGLERLDQSIDPKEYYLVGGTLVVHGSPDASTLASLEKVLRIGIYTHLSNALELSLLVAHSRKLDPPAPTPTLFQAFPPPVESSRPSFDSDSDGGSDPRFKAAGGRRRTGAEGGKWTKTWGGLIGALVGGVKSVPKKGRFGLGLGAPGGKERPFSSLSTVMVERPDGESISTSASSSRSTSTSTTGLSTHRDGSVTPTNPATQSGGQPGMDKFTKACLQIQSTIFSTSPNVSFPPPPLLVRLREAESRAALAPAATTSSYLTRQDASAVAMEFGDDGKSSDSERVAADARRLGEGGAGVFRLTGEARVGIGSLMVGNGSLAAFGRHQSISVLYQVLPLHHPSLGHPSTSSSRPNSPGPLRSPLLTPNTPITPGTPSLPSTPPDHPPPASSSPSPSTSEPSTTSAIPSCVHPCWKTLSYFSYLATTSDSVSPSLGSLVRSIAAEARNGTLCAASGCGRLAAEEHKRIWMHAGTRVMAGAKLLRDKEREEEEEVEGVLVERAEGAAGGDEKERIDCWVECSECGAKTEGRWMSEAAGLFSFAKYLELLVYADSAYSKELCSHTRASPAFFSPASTAHSSPLLRHFRHNGVVVSFSVDVFDIFELKLGKLMVGPSSIPKSGSGSGVAESEGRERFAMREVQSEIEEFYVSLEKRMGALKSHLLGPISSPTSSPKTSTPPPLPPKEPNAVASPSFASLHKLSLSLRQDESTVMDSLRMATPSNLNEARKIFVDKAKEAKARLESWEKKHASDLSTLSIGKADFQEPDYLSQRSVHLLPGSSVVLREDEPASIIAHILASEDYHRELAKLRPAGIFSQPSTPRIEEPSFYLKPVPPQKATRDKDKALPPSPPGSSDSISEAANPSTTTVDAWTLEITRPEPPRDLGTALLSLRAISKKPSTGTISLNAPGLLLPNRLGSLSKGSVSNEPTLSLVGGVEAKMTDEGKGSSLDGGSSAKLLREKMKTSGIEPQSSQTLSHFLESSQDSTSSSASSSSSSVDRTSRAPSSYNRPLSALSGLSDFSLSSSTSPAAREVVTTIYHQHGRSVTSSSTDSSVTVNGNRDDKGEATIGLGLGHPLSESSTSTSNSATSIAPSPRRTTPPSAAPSSILNLNWGANKDDSWTSSLTSGIGNSLSSILGMGTGSFRGKSSKEPAPRASSIHSLLSADNSNAIEERPHIQFAYAIGTKLKISCTVFFASSFDVLRRKLGVEKAIIESLSRTSKWDAQGGKSKALFFKTQDSRYIVKELISKWNVSDVQALLEIAPSYFEFINGTSTKPTALAKIIGFYSCKINNLETGTSTKRDLLIMENIFFDQEVSRSFDLKGITGRRVKTMAGSAPSDVGHDQEWVEGQQKTLLVVHPHSKRILKEALATDAKFLAANSIVDFSLLVGVDEEKKELAVGLVDAIGAFTFFKALESKGKQLASKGLANNRGAAGQVTVLPPDQYGARFEAAMDSYFVACPDKFSAPMHPPSKSNGHNKPPTKKDFAVPSVF